MDVNQITLTTVSVKLDSKKITNSILDQIPRMDFCEALVDEGGSYAGPKSIKPICRFSLVSLLNSERRVYKSNGYDTEHISRLIKCFAYQDEAFLFTIEGQLYCDSISFKTGTKSYSKLHAKLKDNLRKSESHLSNVNRVLELNNQDLSAGEITQRCRNGSIGLPRRKSRCSTVTTEEGVFANWEDDIDSWEDSDETKDANELNRIIKKYGSWGEYISNMKNEMQIHEFDIKKHKAELGLYESEVSDIVGNIKSQPFAILGC